MEIQVTSYGWYQDMGFDGRQKRNSFKHIPLMQALFLFNEKTILNRLERAK